MDNTNFSSEVRKLDVLIIMHTWLTICTLALSIGQSYLNSLGRKKHFEQITETHKN